MDTVFADQTTTHSAGEPLEEDCFSKEIIMKAWMAAANLSIFAATALTAGAAQAGDVSWTVTVGSPRPAPRVIYAPPPVVYAPPQVVYAPPPVVYYPAPAVYQPVPVVYHVPPGHWKHRYKHAKHAYKHGYYHGYRHDD
jgi:hypothetical protein